MSGDRKLFGWKISFEFRPRGVKIIAKNFIDEIPRSKEKEGNSLLTKNTLLIKVIK